MPIFIDRGAPAIDCLHSRFPLLAAILINNNVRKEPPRNHAVRRIALAEPPEKEDPNRRMGAFVSTVRRPDRAWARDGRDAGKQLALSRPERVEQRPCGVGRVFERSMRTDRLCKSRRRNHLSQLSIGLAGDGGGRYGQLSGRDRAIGAGAASDFEDAAIAATAAVHGLTVVTVNERDTGAAFISPPTR